MSKIGVFWCEVISGGLKPFPRRTTFVGMGIAALLALLFVFLGILFQHPQVHDALIDATGETDPQEQVKTLLTSLIPPRLNTQDLAPVAQTDVNPFGVNTFLEQEVEEWKVRRSLALLRDAGVKWIRQQVPWSDIEIPHKGQYLDRYGNSTWKKYDRMVMLARRYGIEMVARLDYPPNWSRRDNSIHNRPPDNFDDFGDFVYTFVSHYKGRLRYYQIWNEPNIYPEWGDQPVDADAYTQLLRIAYTRAKQADPNAVIIAAALAPTLGTPDGKNENDLTFLEKMYRAGAKDYFDIMSVMGYGLWTGPGDRRVGRDTVNFSRPQLIREIMVRYGDAGKAVWVSEVGWNALPPDFPKPATHGRVSEELQARYAAQAYRRAQEEWPWMGVLFYWHFRMVHDVNRDQVMFYFRMADPDFTLHPVYFAYKEMAIAPPTMYYGYQQESHWAIRYDGHWRQGMEPRASLGQYKQASALDNTAEFRFQGTGLRLVTRVGPGAGEAVVEIDGTPQKANSLPKGGLLRLESTQEEWQRQIPLARNLPYGQHTLRVTALTPGVMIDGFIVEKEDRADVERWYGIALLVATALTVAYILWRRATGKPLEATL